MIYLHTKLHLHTCNDLFNPEDKGDISSATLITNYLLDYTASLTSVLKMEGILSPKY
jgi:hypothetical protein